METKKTFTVETEEPQEEVTVKPNQTASFNRAFLQQEQSFWTRADRGDPRDLRSLDVSFDVLYKKIHQADIAIAAAKFHELLRRIPNTPFLEKVIKATDDMVRAALEDIMVGESPRNMQNILENPTAAADLLFLLNPTDKWVVLKKSAPALFMTLGQSLSQAGHPFGKGALRYAKYLAEDMPTTQRIQNIFEANKHFEEYLLSEITSIEQWSEVFQYFCKSSARVDHIAKANPKLFFMLDRWFHEKPVACEYYELLGRILDREEEFQNFFLALRQNHCPNSWLRMTKASPWSENPIPNAKGKTEGELATLLNMRDIPSGYLGHIRLGVALWPDDSWLHRMYQVLSSPAEKKKACISALQCYENHQRMFGKASEPKKPFLFRGLTLDQFRSVLDIPMFKQNVQAGVSGEENALASLKHYITKN